MFITVNRLLLKHLFFIGLFFSHYLLLAQPDQVLALMNEVRTDPQGFLNQRLLPFVKEKQLEDNSYTKSLVAELKAAKKINPLHSSPTLEKLARAHAQDMGSKGKVGHNSSNGMTFENRVRKKSKQE